MLTQLSNSLYSWTEIHGISRNTPYSWSSFLVVAQDALILIDPLSLSDQEIADVERLGTPTHILLTCDYHLRESRSFMQRWGCELLALAAEEQTKSCEISVDDTFRDGDFLWRKIEVIRVQNVRYPEEVSFLVPEEDGTLIIGDLVCGGRADRGISDGSIWINAPELAVDLQKARISLGKLLDYNFNRMVLGHGSPVTDRAKGVLKDFLKSDVVWDKLESERVERGRQLTD